MTSAIEREAREILERIERTGGTLAAIESGLIQREVQESAFRAQQDIDQGRSIIVGVNRFLDKEAGVRPLFQIDPEVEPRQVARVRALRASRDTSRWQAALAAVSRAASDGSNLVMPIVSAVEARATVGEIADALRVVFGVFDESR
jgi:methylmalonyl-CoA mutase N-terminal domain/subunit